MKFRAALVAFVATVGLWVSPGVRAQTGCQAVSQAQLLQWFSDNADWRSITPQMLRDFVCSTSTGGGSTLPPVIYASSGSISSSDTFSVINCSATCAMTLAASATDGFVHTVKSYGSGTITLTATIDGSNQAWTMTSAARPYSSFSLVWSAALSTYLAE